MELALRMCTLRQKPAEPAHQAIIQSMRLAKISRDGQRAIVSVSPSQDFVSWLIQSRLACFPAGRKVFFFPPQRQLFNRDHGCSHLEHKRGAPSPTNSQGTYSWRWNAHNYSSLSLLGDLRPHQPEQERPC